MEQRSPAVVAHSSVEAQRKDETRLLITKDANKDHGQSGDIKRPCILVRS